MNELALFAGAGGGILGGHLLGWRTRCAVEIDSYARQVLLARQADGCLPRFPIWNDITTFNGAPWRGHIDIVSGGFPCQDISAAGKGAGITGERSGLWKEMARIIGEVRPSFAWLENSPLLVDRGLAVVLGDLAEMGYDARWGIVGAHHASAPHKRDRIWILAYTQGHFKCDSVRPQWLARDIFARSSYLGRAGAMAHTARGGVSDTEAADVAYTKSARVSGELGDNFVQKAANRPSTHESDSSSQSAALDDVANSSGHRGKAGLSGSQQREDWYATELIHGDTGCTSRAGWWSAEPNVGGMVDGMASRLDIHGTHPGLDVGRLARGVSNRGGRLKAIGNGQVPAALVLAWHLMTVEENREEG